MSVFLALFPPNASEVHVRWDGHQTVESATKELNQVREMMIKDNKVPMDCYVYEADAPPFGLPIFAIDDVDFNFYREKTKEEIEASKKRFDAAMKLVEKTKDTVERAEELAMKIKTAVEAKQNA
jgi:hypothetical protein